MKEENNESKKLSDFNEDEEYKNLPEFIKSMIGNIYDSSSQKNSNSEKSNNSNSKSNSNSNICSNNAKKITKFIPKNNYQKKNNNNKNDGNIKIFNIKDSNLSIMKKSLRIKSILQNNKKDYMNNIKECSICFRIIINYGLLSNCDDIFCYECIKQWRNEAKIKNKREMFRRCPICNKESPLLIKSKFYLVGEEKRQKMIEFRLETNNN